MNKLLDALQQAFWRRNQAQLKLVPLAVELERFGPQSAPGVWVAFIAGVREYNAAEAALLEVQREVDRRDGNV